MNITSKANSGQIVMNGSIRAQFDMSLTLDLLEWITTDHREYVPLEQLRNSAVQSPEIKYSPSMSKSSGRKAQQQRQKELQAAKDQQSMQAPIPNSIISEWGLTPAVMELLEVSSTHHCPLLCREC